MIACPTLLVLRRVTTIYGGFGVLETSVSQGSIAVLSYLSFGGRSLRAAVCIAAFDYPVGVVEEYCTKCHSSRLR